MFNRLDHRRCLLVGLSGLAACFARTPDDPFGDRWFFDNEGGGGGGNEEDPPRRADPVVTAAKYNNDVGAMARHIIDIEGDNYKLRRKRDELQRDVDGLKAKVPAEGAVVLSSEDAAKLQAYAALGTPDELLQRVKEGATAIAERNALQREKLQARCGELTRLKPSAFSAKWLGEAVPVIEGEGDDAQVFVVEGEGAAAKKTEWEKFVEANSELSDVLPALRINDANGAANGTPYPGQGAGGGQGQTASANRYAHNLDKD